MFAHSAEKTYPIQTSHPCNTLQLIPMENSNFRTLIKLTTEKGNFNSILKIRQEQYLIKLYKIGELQPDSVSELYHKMQKKFYVARRKQQEEFWYENELRIFIWLMFAYLYVFEKQLTDLKEDDWNYFSQIFNFKSAVFFEFQALSIVKAKGRPSVWGEEQSAILQAIISQKKFKNRWNSIARALFTKSGRRFFRNPKQCRERWMNHLDPVKLHSEWTISEDLVLLNTIKKKGKKWSLAAKELRHTRTEHMVKNRYKSLISNQCKKFPGKRQAEIQKILIKRLQKMMEKTAKSQQQKEEQANHLNHGTINACESKIENPKPIIQQEMKPNQAKGQQQEKGIQQLDFHCEQPFGRSPAFLDWRPQYIPKLSLNLMQDEEMDVEDHLYDYSSPQGQSFLRF